MDHVKILVCSHKEVEYPKNSLYLPVQVGASLNPNRWGIQPDNEGENISDKNKFYSELTAHFWAWKNLKNVEYVGLAHYRRFLDINSESEIMDELSRYDILLPAPISLPYCNGFNLGEVLTREDVYILMTCLKKMYPEYIDAANKYLMQSNKNVCCNMFITKHSIFDEYSEWLFPLLLETEKHVRLSGYTRIRRIFGYFSEVLLPIYVLHNNLKVKYYPLVDFPGVQTNQKKKIKTKLRYILSDLSYHISKIGMPKVYKPMPSTHTGMIIDKLPLWE